MDQVLLAFPPDGEISDKTYDTEVKKHINRVESLFREQTSVVLPATPQLLELVNPSVNSISFLAIINTLKHADNSTVPVSRSELTKHALRFLQSFDARQIRYVGESFLHLVREVIDLKWIPGPQAVQVLAAVILRLDSTGQVLTSTHCSLAELAFESGQLAPVLPVIEKPYVFVPAMADQSAPQYLCDLSASPASYISHKTGLTGKLTKDMVMHYDYLCGRIFSSLRKWDEAHAAFGRVVTFPTSDGTLTQTMIDAYKKWMLTGNIALGRRPELPPYVHPTASRNYGVMGKPYLDLATVFASGSAPDLRSEAEKSAKTWEEDGNFDLVKEVLAAAQKWAIMDLSNLYTRLSLNLVRELTKSGQTGESLATEQEVEDLIRGMIESGMLRATLTQQHSDGTKCLAFLSRGEDLSEEEFASKMKGSVDSLKALGHTVETTNLRLTMNKDYAKHVLRDQKRQEKGDTNDPGIGFEQSIEDEDLMTGIMHTM
ncbi:hypothetical protein SODALDRAFT_279922 [Sodiomyces alkalinus F11]|uniref:COP9 signalosome complex subunit 3 N-terminal helical repeats domain-containing protein n=1 Tax=Sodiomyces alkalinus (strain CBS 110278 / VKM F-3762 / F11) TaxID=1314773 RepID=A0A3N2PT93_SODAK|nr:hypothetical protein SODALDRAFT_279922 [Sodiomyces alkalinus F11]ROT37720.1 hypothetical protein SODALDRAFT_279922 [Sodiomyces alkalinus F11]